MTVPARACRLLSAVILGLGMSAALSPVTAQDILYFQIATGPSGGTEFGVGQVVAAALSNPAGSVPCEDGGPCGVPGMVAVALTTAGSLDNAGRLADGSVDAALIDADAVYWAYHGTGRFAGRPPMTGMRAVANLYPAIFHIIVPADSPITDPAQLGGRRVAIGQPGSGTHITAQTVFSAFGIDFADLGVLEIRPGPAADLLATGGADAMVVTGGVPVKAVADLAGRMPIRILPLDGTVGEDITAFAPFLTRAAIPPNKYAGVPRTVSVAVGVQLVVGDHQPVERIEAITRALWHDRSLDLFVQGPLEVARPLLDRALTGVAIPLHDGARRYYDSLGDKRPSR